MSRKTGGLSRGSRHHRRGSGPGTSRLLWIGGMVVILAFAVSVVLAGGLLQGSGKAKGDIAPDITLATTEGDFRISDQRGDVVVLYYSFPG